MGGTPPSKLSGTSNAIVVTGARVHNLRDVNVAIPRDSLVAFTGVSGSGKSSLAFGTLYAEAQRRYFESVAPYARRLMSQVDIPDVDAIEGLPPAVALPQQRTAGSARSTVGSATSIGNVVRMLFSRVGTYPDGAEPLFAEDFSANTVQGACPRCHGLGQVYDVPLHLMVPDESLTIRDRALDAWPRAWHGKQLIDSLISLGYDIDIPWRDLPEEQRRWVLYTEESPQVPVFTDRGPAQVRKAVAAGIEPSYMSTFVGVRQYVLNTFANSKSAKMREKAATFMVSVRCPMCDGRRLKPEALAVTFAGLDITEMAGLPLADLATLLETALDRSDGGSGADHAVGAALSPEKQLAAQRLVDELRDRVSPIIELGLGYLSLDRSTPTLSSGELQRMRLATQVLSQLFGVMFVLDEPSAGLHPADGEALVRILRSLRDSGNTVFFVEHSLDVIRHADWIVDIGPGAGATGGEIVYSGPIDGLREAEHSQTRRYLFADDLRAEQPTTPRPASRRARRPARAHRCLTQQPPQRLRVDPPRLSHRRHRRLRVGQVVSRHPGSARSAAEKPLQRGGQLDDRLVERRAEQHDGGSAVLLAARRDDRSRFGPRRPRAARRAGQPEADRPHVAIERGDLYGALRPRPRPVRRD